MRLSIQGYAVYEHESSGKDSNNKSKDRDDDDGNGNGNKSNDKGIPSQTERTSCTRIDTS